MYLKVRSFFEKTCMTLKIFKKFASKPKKALGSRPVHDSKTWFGSCLEISATLITLRNFIVLTQTVQVTN